MLPTFFGLNTVTRALLAQQEAVDVLNQNIANVQTPGYSRQDAQLEATDPYTDVAFNRPSLAGQLGTGSFVARINRFQDELLNSQIRYTNQSVGQLQVMDDHYTQIQAIYNDPSNVALNSAASTFFNSIHDLTNNPESDSARQLVQQNGATLAHAISTRYQQLITLQQDLNTKTLAIVRDINSIVRQIAGLNNHIAESRGVGDNPNDLMDKRDALIDSLSKLVDVRVVKNPDGTDTVQMNGRFLVKNDQAYLLTTLTDASSPALVKPVKVFWADDVTKFLNYNPGYDPITGRSLTTNQPTTTPPLSVPQALISTGSLFGTMDIRDRVIQDTLLPELNELSDALTNTQVLSRQTGLKASTQLVGTLANPDDFTVTVITPPGTATPPGPGQMVTTRVGASAAAIATAAGRTYLTVQDVVDAINSSSVSPFVHATLSAAGQLQIDTITTGALVKVDQANGAASKDFGFSQSVADGFNMVHVQGYGLNTPPQWQGGISGLTLDTAITIGDQIDITAPDGSASASPITVSAPPPVTNVYPAPATTTVRALIEAINAKGVSHGFQAALDAQGHLQIFSTPTVYGADGHLVGTAAQVTSDNVTTALTTNTRFTQASSFDITTQASGGPVTFNAAMGSTLGSLITQINAANIGVTASINSVGQLQLTSTGTGSGQRITISATTGDFDATVANSLVPLVMSTTNGLDHGFPPSSRLTVAIGSTSPQPATGKEAQDFFGGSGFPPAVTNTNSNQFFYQGASQVLQGAVLASTNVSGSPFGTFLPMQSPAEVAFSLSDAPGSTATYAGGANIQVNGIDPTTGLAYGAPETITVGANGVYQTTRVYSAITSVAVTGVTNANIQGWSTLPMTEADTAGAIVVDPNIVTNPSEIAASSQPGIAGNASNALAMLNVEQQSIVSDGRTATTFGDFYGTVTESLGASAQQTNTDRISQEQLVEHFTNQKQSVVGVNLDEEAAHLVALQHAYQAAARAINVQDSMLDTIINGMGLVGRA